MVDYQKRAAYLLSQVDGNVSGLSESTGLSRRTLRRVLTERDKKGAQKPYKPSKMVRDKINRTWYRKATKAAKRAEKKYGQSQPKLLPYDEAKRLENFYIRNGLSYHVSVQTIEFLYDRTSSAGTQVGLRKVLYGSKDTVEEAWDYIENYFNQWVSGELEGSPEITIIDPPPPFDLKNFTYFRVYQPKKIER